MELNFDHVTKRLDNLEDRMSGIEEKHTRFERLHATPPSSASSSSPPERGRNWRSPPELQVCFGVTTTMSNGIFFSMRSGEYMQLSMKKNSSIWMKGIYVHRRTSC